MRPQKDRWTTPLQMLYGCRGDALRGEIGGVYRDARAHTDSQVTAVRDELKAEGDSLRGEIGGVYRDARAHTDSQVTAVRDELSRDIIAGTSAAVAYTDASSLALQDEIKRKKRMKQFRFPGLIQIKVYGMPVKKRKAGQNISAMCL